MSLDRGLAQSLGDWKRSRLGEPQAASCIKMSKIPVRMYVCAAKGCGKSFDHYVGVKTKGPRGSGLGLCQEHNPEFQKKIQENGDGVPASVSPAA
jgi:hypothetical protein